MDDHRLGRGDGPNRGLMAHINRALVRIYGWVQLLWLGIAAVVGTAIIWSSLRMLPDRTEGLLAWAAFVLLSMVRLRMRSEVHTSELQSLMRISYAVFCLKKKKH